MKKRQEVDLIIFIKSLILQYISNLLDIVIKLDDDTIISNSTIIYYFNYSIYKSIVILYSYEYYLTMINNYILNNNDNDIDFKNFIEKILPDTTVSNVCDDTNYDECINKIEIDDADSAEITESTNDSLIIKKDCAIKDNTDDNADENIKLMTRVYEIIIEKFIKEILLHKNTKTLSLNIMNNYANKIIVKFELTTTNIEKIKSRQYMYLIIKNYFIVDKISVLNNYVTIPQYMGICWYVSILTGMCYSDASRKLIKSNFANLKKLQSEKSIKESDKSFINVIIYIIENITDKQLIYTENITTNCSLFIYLKDKVPEFLLYKINELCNDIKSKIIGDNDYYFNNICNGLISNENITFNDIKAVGNNIYGFLY